MPNNAPAPIAVTTPSIACDGNNGGPGGHPRVFLALNGTGRVDCPYCGRRFVLATGAKAQGH